MRAGAEMAAAGRAAGERMRILFVVRGLNVGGAQRQLVAAARGLRRRGHDVSVAVFYAGGIFEQDLRDDGIAVHDLARRSRWESVSFMARMVRLVRERRPDVVHAYMGGANLFSAALKPLFGPVKVVWGIRDAIPDRSAYGRLAVTGDWLERTVAPLADAVVANSRAARDLCGVRGMDLQRVMVIPNGIDCDAFRRDPAEGRRVRREWGVADDAPVVGMVARLDPVKGHATFLRAAAEVSKALPEARFVCVGTGVPAYRDGLLRLAGELGLGDRVVWAGETRVSRATYSAFDVAVLSSNVGESFPNTVAEAMACGAPCVVTDSGDLRDIVGDTGAVVRPGDAAALAAGTLDLLARTRAPGSAAAQRARARIEREFSVPVLVDRLEHALEEVLRLPTRVLPRAGAALPFTGRAAP